MTIEFDWDLTKAKTNLAKHKVSFETAALVFIDPAALVEQDRYVDGEVRWQTIGMAHGHLILLVAHTSYDAENNVEVIRIISARKVDPKERKRYENSIR
jgi:uncharacterized protein